MNKKKLAVVCALALLAAACNKQEKTYSTPAGDIKVSEKSGTTTYEAKDNKGEKVKMESNDKGVALPDKFPSDVPMMKGAIVKMAISSGDNLSVNFSVAATPAEVGKYYEENLKSQGWTIGTTANMGDMAVVSAKKDKRECVVTAGKEGTGAVVQLVLPQAKS